MSAPGGGMPMPGPGQMPTPQQIAEMQRKLAADAQKAGMTVPQFIEFIKKKQAEAQAQAQKQAQQGHNHDHDHDHHGHNHNHNHNHQQGEQPQPIQPGPPKPEALAIANFLRGQNLKPRTCILNGQRKDMFKVKRALRALQSPAYTKARSRNPLLPEITDRASLENTFKLLPMSLLALRVSKLDPAAEHEGHNHAPPPKTKRVKGLWTVKIEQQQECKEEMHYVWLYEGSQWRTKLYAIGALVVIFAVVLFPLWPMKLRLGVWYLSVGMLGLIGLFFAMAIVRLIIWLVTAATMKQSFILYPNLFEDVGFFDSFKPVYAWSGEEKGKKKSKKVKSKGGAAAGSVVQVPGQPPPASATTTGAAPQMTTSVPIQRSMAPRVEEVFDDE